MSREDPQLRIRLPAQLKEEIEIAAKSNNRSMNAEIVHRLGSVPVIGTANNEVLSAKAVLHIAKQARQQLPDLIYSMTIDEMSQKAKLGHTRFKVDLRPFALNGLILAERENILKHTVDSLTNAGFVVRINAPEHTDLLIEALE
ncbi:Arc family DNA-binding protein [Citrobacter freundii]|nr:Arc family DNA-binding protein [Citrobacter freundii]